MSFEPDDSVWDPDLPTEELFEAYLARVDAKERAGIQRADSVTLGSWALAGESGLDEGSPELESLLEQIASARPRHLRYQPVSEVARGGQGVVLHVWDSDIRRALAMKVSHDRLEKVQDVRGRHVLARFLREVHLTGQLEHPGIVPVHDLGVDPKGRVYFTMRLVEGRELREVFRLVRDHREGWNTARGLALVQRACETVAYAHSKGVIHRDLKPSNIMIGPFGEVYVMDWGLAKLADDSDRLFEDAPDADSFQSLDPSATRHGTVIGTPAYMPPEQARGEIESIDERSDVYSMGAILYHLLTGHSPYLEPGERISGVRMLERVVAGPPVPVETHNPWIPHPLREVCARAMAREPDERHANCMELSEELRELIDAGVLAGRRPRDHVYADTPTWWQAPWARWSLAAAVLVLVALSAHFLGSLTAPQPVHAVEARLLSPEISGPEAGDEGVFLRVRYRPVALAKDASTIEGHLEFRDLIGRHRLRARCHVADVALGQTTPSTPVMLADMPEPFLDWLGDRPLSHLSVIYVAEKVWYEDRTFERF